MSDEERQASYRFHFNVEYKTTKQSLPNKETKPKENKHEDLENRFVFTREEGDEGRKCLWGGGGGDEGL